MNVRKPFVILLAFMMLLGGILLTGCANNTSKTQAGDENKEETSSGVVELEMWVHETNEAEDEFYKQRIADFNKAYEGKIKVNLIGTPRGGGAGYEDKINAALAAGNLPDILDLDGPNVAAYADSGIIAPLGDYFTEDELSDFVGSIIEQGSYNGSLYNLGAMESSVVLYYNKTLLEEAGLTPVTSVADAWTWDELYEAAKKLKKGDEYPLQLFMHYGVGEWLTYMGTPLVWSNGGSLISEDGTTTEGYLNGPETVEALEFVRTLFSEELVNIAPKGTEFEEGNAALALGGPWIAAGLANYPDLEWGMMPYPMSNVAKSPSGSWGYSITTNTKHPKEAAEVVKWMTNKESTIGLSGVTGMPPSRVSAFEELPRYTELPWKIIMDQLNESAQARPRTPAYPVLTKEFAEAFNAAALGEDPKPILDKAVKRVDRELKRFNK